MWRRIKGGQLAIFYLLESGEQRKINKSNVLYLVCGGLCQVVKTKFLLDYLHYSELLLLSFVYQLHMNI